MLKNLIKYDIIWHKKYKTAVQLLAHLSKDANYYLSSKHRLINNITTVDQNLNYIINKYQFKTVNCIKVLTYYGDNCCYTNHLKKHSLSDILTKI